jgi:hypothetical protein
VPLLRVLGALFIFSLVISVGPVWALADDSDALPPPPEGAVAEPAPPSDSVPPAESAPLSDSVPAMDAAPPADSVPSAESPASPELPPQEVTAEPTLAEPAPSDEEKPSQPSDVPDRHWPASSPPRRFFGGLGGDFAFLLQNSDYNSAIASINTANNTAYPGFALNSVNAVYGINAYAGYRVTEQLGLALNFDWNTANSSTLGTAPGNTGSFAESIATERFGIGVKGFYELVRTRDLTFYAAPCLGVNFFTSTIQLAQTTSAATNTTSGTLNSTNVGASLGFGINYYLSSRFGIYAEAGYQFASASVMNLNTTLGTSTFQQTLPLNMSGVYITFGITGIFGGWPHSSEAPMSTMAY